MTNKKLKSAFHGEPYGKVVWRAEDVHIIKPNWTLDKCEDWLGDNERHISDRLIELGWEVMDTLLSMENDDD